MIEDWWNYYDRKTIWFKFESYNGDPGEWSIIEGEYNDDDLENIQESLSGPALFDPATDISRTTIKAYNGNAIVYLPIPYDLIHTQHTNPQVLMTVDELPVACREVDCDYIYTVADAEVSGFSVSTVDGEEVLSITGTAFTDRVYSIFFADTHCSIKSIGTTAITCTLDNDVAAGLHKPLLTDYFGLVPDSVSTMDISLVVSSVSPDSDVNPNGGTQITISGSGFPFEEDNAPSDFSLEFDNGNTCVVLSMTSTQIVCRPGNFVTQSTDYTLTLTMNSKAYTRTVGVGVNIYTVDAVSPASVSPVLKQTLTITLGTDITLDSEDLSVYLNSETDSENDKELNVYEVDNGAKTISARFGGAWSGTYTVNVISAVEGKFSSVLSLDVSGTITGISPSTGSSNGGTLVTVTGTNFDTDVLNNPISINWLNAEVISSTETSILFRTPVSSHGDNTYEIVVGLKTSEEAVCNDATDSCMFTFSSSITSVLGSLSVGNNVDGSVEITLGGTGFGSSAEVYLDGEAQEIVSVSDTAVVVKVTNIVGKTASTIEFYSEFGYPQDNDSLLAAIDFSDNIKLVSVETSEGSVGGSEIVVNVAGIGAFEDGSVEILLKAGSTSVCDSLSVPEYGVIVCKLSGSYTSQELTLSVDGTSHSCLTTSACDYSSSLDPQVTSVSSDGSSLTLTGSGLSLASYSVASVNVNGVAASTVVVNSPTEIEATFDLGAPITEGDATAEVEFVSSDDTDRTVHYATVTGIYNRALSSVSASTVTSSFAGGKSLLINNSGGLTSAISGGFASISVCGAPCELDSDLSDASATYCSVPELSSTYSEYCLGLNEKGSIIGEEIFGDDDTNAEFGFDGENQLNYESSDATCHVGTGFAEGTVGLLTQAAYMMNAFDRDLFVGQLEFQGSNTNSASNAQWTTLHLVEQEIHEGFNYISFESDFDSESDSLSQCAGILATDDMPRFRYYRFYNPTQGGCYIGEIVLTGYIVESSETSTLSCTPELVYGSTTTALTGSVTYDLAITPVVSSISPQWGSVIGGEEIVFTLEDASGLSVSDITITIDGIDCSISNVDSSSGAVTCTTGERTGLPDHSLLIEVVDQGLASLAGNDFLYVNLWSEEATWGYELEPIEGESVYIPAGLNLLVDVDSTPVLNLVLIEGSLIFPSDSDSSHQRTFEAHIIFINGGKFEAGSEEEPYTSKLAIILHGEKFGALIPTFGNKCLANYKGTLDIHGVVRSHSWTELSMTAAEGSYEITVDGEVDWAVGEEIVIAPTAYVYNEDEKRTITKKSTSGGKTTLSFDQALRYKHFSETETFDSFTMPMKGEVALLSRNVVF